MTTIPESEGRSLFGQAAASYDQVRPAYPAWMFEKLEDEGVLRPGTNTLDVGAGSGIASWALAERGAYPLTLVEPDKRFAGHLAAVVDGEGTKCRVLHEPFETVNLPAAGFDLAVCATTFHWLAPESRVARLAKVVRPGGAVALLWNVFQDLDKPDPFHEATRDLMAPLASSPSGKPDALPFALDRQHMVEEFTANSLFSDAFYGESRWPFTLDPSGVRALYAGFSGVAAQPPSQREDLLDKLETIARDNFNGQVIRNMTSPLYLFIRTES